MQVTLLPHDCGAILSSAFCISIKARGKKNTRFRGCPERASENMNTFTVSRLIFNAGLPSVDVFRSVQ